MHIKISKQTQQQIDSDYYKKELNTKKHYYFIVKDFTWKEIKMKEF